MGVHRLQTFLKTDVSNVCYRNVDIKTLAAQYRQETGKQPLMVVDGSNCVRKIYMAKDNGWVLGGDMLDFIKEMKSFVSAFRSVDVDIIFYFDGVTCKDKLRTWILRRDYQMEQIGNLFCDLENKRKDLSEYSKSIQSPLIGATGQFAIKFECSCNVRLSVEECDWEIAEFARKEGCFAVLSGDSDFAILQGARYYFLVDDLDLATMTTSVFIRDDLLTALGLQSHQLFLLASLLGNDIISFEELKTFHTQFCSGKKKKRCLLPKVAQYVKKWEVQGDYSDKVLQEIALDVFQDEDRFKDLKASIRSYQPQQAADEEEKTSVATNTSKVEENWRQIKELARGKHVSSSTTKFLYGVIMGDGVVMGVSQEDYRNKDIVCVAKMYRSLRQRIYGILLLEKPGGATTVEELCVESDVCPTEYQQVSIEWIPNLRSIHPGLQHLWKKDCSPKCRWRLFAESLTQKKKLDASSLENLDFAYVVPVAVLFYLKQEWPEQLGKVDVEVILAMAATIKCLGGSVLYSMREYPSPGVVHLSTIFNRGMTIVFFLMSACGFALDKVMPWFYFDGKLLLDMYTKAIRGASNESLCGYKDEVYRDFRHMLDIVQPRTSWR
ncbi:constitutive coactivator of peroxisome proliferator-activated receptor gamma-like isoform X1 [Periplaneta americana]|uniref:constitutive coactivator of peroxisome proliferator-activated receptor gamma-like isoform X1 n=1 Tax=Periplaneta americana TaxID=6978 RepID=UPI0037E8098B